jgi:membrane-bound ClpP family serine protease
MRRRDRVATIIFRVLVGAFGLLILVVAIYFRLYSESWKAFTTLGAFCGLLLGYAFGGDRWGARLFTLFTGHRVLIDDTQKKRDSGTQAAIKSSNQAMQRTAGRSDV